MIIRIRNFVGMGIRKKIAALFFSLIIITTISLSSSLAFADGRPGYTPLDEAGLEFVSGLSTLLYLPVKSIYAGVGAVVGGIAWALSGGNDEVGESIWAPSIYGNYVITPDHLTGNAPLQFIGPSS